MDCMFTTHLTITCCTLKSYRPSPITAKWIAVATSLFFYSICGRNRSDVAFGGRRFPTGIFSFFLFIGGGFLLLGFFLQVVGCLNIGVFFIGSLAGNSTFTV